MHFRIRSFPAVRQASLSGSKSNRFVKVERLLTRQSESSKGLLRGEGGKGVGDLNGVNGRERFVADQEGVVLEVRGQWPLGH